MAIIYNPASGSGRASRIAHSFQRALADAGHEVQPVRVGAPRPTGWVPDVLVLVGGDGTVKHALDEAIAAGVPIYHVPLGNENLFAREYSMTRDPARLRRALDDPRVHAIDVGVVEHGPARQRFAIMLSVGPDASVIHRMDADGRSARGHLAYVAPIAEELADPGIEPITLDVDGRRVVDAQPGLLVVANLRRYAFGIDPARNADPRDALLDAVFIPATTPGRLIWAAACAALGRLDRIEGVVAVRGSRFEINAPGGKAQADGEPLRLPMPLTASVEPRALRVLRPPRG